MEVYINWISGVQVGIEFLTGKQIQPEDNLVVMMNLGIFRVSLVFNK